MIDTKKSPILVFMKLKLLFLALISITILSCKPVCNTDAYNAVAAVYAFAVAYPEDFPQYVIENKVALTSAKIFDHCIDRFSAALLASAISSPSRIEIEEQSMRIASDAGNPAMGMQLADDMMETSGDLYRLSGFMQQIKNSVPEILNGNVQSFYNTEIYQLSALMWNMSKQILYPQQIKAIRDMTYRLSYWYVSNLSLSIK